MNIDIWWHDSSAILVYEIMFHQAFSDLGYHLMWYEWFTVAFNRWGCWKQELWSTLKNYDEESILRSWASQFRNGDVSWEDRLPSVNFKDIVNNQSCSQNNIFIDWLRWKYYPQCTRYRMKKQSNYGNMDEVTVNYQNSNWLKPKNASHYHTGHHLLLNFSVLPFGKGLWKTNFLWYWWFGCLYAYTGSTSYTQRLPTWEGKLWC